MLSNKPKVCVPFVDLCKAILTDSISLSFNYNSIFESSFSYARTSSSYDHFLQFPRWSLTRASTVSSLQLFYIFKFNSRRKYYLITRVQR